MLFFSLQYRLWKGEGSLLEVVRLNKKIQSEKQEVEKLISRNQILDAEVTLLKTQPQALEDRARGELGMIKRGETFCLVVEPAR